MTDVSTQHPSGLPYIELTEEGRKIAFRKECLGSVEIRRRVDEGEETLIASGTRPPFVDADDFPAGTHITYSILLDQNQQRHRYTLEARL